ncbi:tRNA N6-adenosine threonylcarbamoyltransferase [Planctomycetales bacterium 10988]|nr:tRNA N6-adenosine threonylcarbamoyltransferase [Planctomycetales bacterium 10988]
MRPLLIIESTCDETAVAVVDERHQVLSSVVASQEALHERFGGVVPEIAARAHLERMLPTIDQALEQAGLELSEISGIAVANTPGLAGSLLVGVAAAKALCVAFDLPLLAVNHLQAHIYACQLTSERNVFPCIGFIVSGGHTNLYRCESPLDFTLLGSTIDDAAGEAFDKVASMLGLTYPGGPSIQKAAENGDPKKYSFPRSFLHQPDRMEFSFSGLKTAVRYQISRTEPPHIAIQNLNSQEIADLAASFQAAVVEVLVGKVLQAVEKYQLPRICVGGGVAANRAFRERLTNQCQKKNVELVIAPNSLCTDNAVMGAIAWERWRAGLFESLDLDAYPGLVRQD